MSAKCLAQLAVERDKKTPGESVADNSTDVLTAAVPTEALAAYTAVVGVVLAANIGSAYGPFRWAAYGIFVALAVLVTIMLFKHCSAATDMDYRKLPILECLTAGVAAAAWGLVMPGSPLAMVYKGDALVFATTAILFGAAALVGLASQRLRTANNKNPKTDEATAHAADEAAPHTANGAVSRTVGDQLGGPGSVVVHALRIDRDLRPGRDHVRVVVVATVGADNVAEAA